MGLINEEIEVLLQSSMITYYEKLGYDIPRVKKNYKWTVPQGTTIIVKISDLPTSSNQYVDVKCDCSVCNKTKHIMYSKYNKNIERNNGIYLCSYDSIHRDFLNGISYESIIECIKSYYNKTGRFPKYNEYTKENGFPFNYSKISEFFKKYGTTLNEELSKIDCFKVSQYNNKYYDVYLKKLLNIVKMNHQIGNNLSYLSREDYCKKYEVPNIRWFIEHCPDKSVHNIDTFKEWAGLYTRHMSKEQCTEIILDMVKKYDRPLMYDDFRGHEYGQVTITMIKEHWGSLNKMKQDLGLEINIDSMIDKQLSKEDFDNMIIDICKFVHNENRNFITTREIDEHSEWSNADTLQRTTKKYYGCKLQDILSKHNVSLGKQGNGINFDFPDGEHVTSQFEYMFSKYLRDYGLKYNVDYFRDVKYSTFIPEYKNNMNCDYVIHINNKTIYIEIAGIIAEYKTWFYDDRVIGRSKSKENYRLKLKKKEEMLKSHNLIYFILFPCDLTKDNFKNILENGSLELKKDIENFNQNNIDWVKIRNTTGELDYSKPFLRDTRPKKEAV